MSTGRVHKWVPKTEARPLGVGVGCATKQVAIPLPKPIHVGRDALKHRGWLTEWWRPRDPLLGIRLNVGARRLVAAAAVAERAEGSRRGIVIGPATELAVDGADVIQNRGLCCVRALKGGAALATHVVDDRDRLTSP